MVRGPYPPVVRLRIPFNPRPLKESYPKRMTIALGFLAAGGAVIAADSQETDGVGFKDFALKVTASFPHPLHSPSGRSVVAITGCGTAFQLDAVSDEIRNLAQSRDDWTAASFEPELGRCVKIFRLCAGIRRDPHFRLLS